MRKKGFTLVELLAVIVILAIILAIAIPTITGIINNATKDSFKSDAKLVIQGVSYALLKDDTLDLTTISFNSKTAANKSTFTAATGVSTDNYKSVKIIKNNGIIQIEIIGNNTGKWAGLVAYGTMQNMNVVNLSDYIVGTIPTITLNGNATVQAVQNDTYSDLGATANDNEDGNLTSSIVMTSDVDLSTIGTYHVYYDVTDSDNNDAVEVVRTVNVVASNDTSGANKPVLASNMIPVMYYNGAWVKADASNASGGTYAWYNYTGKQWANAVTVTSGKLSTYKSAAAGTTVSESDILTYLVWIPRYKYAIPSGSGYRTINITFEKSVATKSTGDATGTNYRTHPAFTFGTEELSGIWVGKFETSVDPASACYSSTTSDTLTANCITSALTVRVKPNVYSWRYAQVSNFFTAIKNMMASSNIYGFSSSEVDTHMMKDSEWGAVAYLSASTYGKNSEVWINPNDNFITGQAGASVSASHTSSTVAYDTTNGVNASTSGTVYGVYDMSGGANEYVMGNYNNYSGYGVGGTIWNSGFNGPNGADVALTTGIAFPASKYYDLFTTGTVTTACSGGICYGQALSETSGWNSDSAMMISSSYPWFMRGGDKDGTTGSGIFYYYYSIGGSGSAYSINNVGARVVVTN